MGFNNVGPLTLLVQGQSVRWTYAWNGEDHGAQYASADVKRPSQGAVHVAFDQEKSLDNNGTATYAVSIKNIGPGACWHNLQGGGFS
jgi:hypothetical protein